MSTAPASLPPVAWSWLGVIAAARLGLWLLSSGALAYGFMSDEFYYIDCARHLGWGYVDHPPLSIAVLGGARAVFGDSLLALRFVPALMGSALVVVVGLLARELGGGRAAQGLAGLAALFCPVYLAVTGFWSMNAFEPVLWALAALLVARIVNGGSPRVWLLLGLVLGLGLLNKISTLWLGAGLGVGLLLTPERRWLATPWPWLCGAIALLLFAPHLLWQVQNDWATLEFMRNATTHKMVAKSPQAFLSEQLLVIGPVLVPLWLAGLVYLFASDAGSRYRVLGWIWIAVIGILIASGSARSNYSGPAYVVLFAAGGVAFERAARSRAWRWLPATAACLFVIGGAASAPLAIPLLSPDRYVAYERAIGIQPPADEKSSSGQLPLHMALRFGWPELIAAVEKAHATLAPEERERAGVYGSWFGDTGAVNFFGPERGLPPAVTRHNSYWLWGPGDLSGDVMLVLSASDEGLRELYESVERVADVDCEWCTPAVDALSVYVCRRPRRPIDEVWPGLKRYI